MSNNQNTKTTESTQPQVEKNVQSGFVVCSSVRAGKFSLIDSSLGYNVGNMDTWHMDKIGVHHAI